MSNKGLLFVVAAPSGGGKSSLVKALLQQDPGIHLSVSHTTRPQRPGEVNGQHYYFVDEATFKQKQEQGEFVETARVFENYYGTSQKVIDELLVQGRDVALDIDWQGAQQIKTLFPGNSVGIYILPPSMTVLEERLRARGQDDEATIRYRMSRAEEELSHCHEFEYLVVNDDFDTALQDIQAIVRSARLKYVYQWPRYCLQKAD